MTNAEIVMKADEIVREAFEKCHAVLIGSSYDYDKFELDSNGIEITGYDYHCGGDYESFHIPYADLDDIDGFLVRRQAEIAEQKRLTAEKKAAEEAQRKAVAEKKERETYLTLKEKYEGVAQ